MRNLGPVSRRWLAEIGVHDLADLRRMGAVEAYRLVKDRQRRATMNLLYGLAAAIADCDWREIPEAEKRRLRKQLADLDERG
jgi:DNA transformation protein and related proteins